MKIVWAKYKKRNLEKNQNMDSVFGTIWSSMDVWVAFRSAHHWARGLLRPPTASPENWARVYCGCKPGPIRVALHPGRRVEVPERQLDVRWTTTYYDFEEMRNVDFIPSHPSSTCSWLRSGRLRDHVHISPLSNLIHLFILGLLTRARRHVA